MKNKPKTKKEDLTAKFLKAVKEEDEFSSLMLLARLLNSGVSEKSIKQKLGAKNAPRGG